MADRFEDMKVFVHIVENQSISGAADKLDIAPSAVSRRLKDLEERLSAQLVQRTTRQMNLTETGKQFYDRAKQVLADLDEAEQLASDENCALSGNLRISLPLTYGHLILAPIIYDFMDKHPELIVDLSMSDQRVDLMEEGFDATIRIGVLEDSSLITRKLSELDRLVTASPAFLEKHGPLDTLESLSKTAGLIYSNSQHHVGAWDYVSKTGEKGQVRPITRMKSNDGATLLRAALAGLGIIRTPDFLVKHALESGELVEILPEYDWGTYGVHLLYAQNRHVPARLRSLIDHFAQAL